jgi:hypothetical protein
VAQPLTANYPICLQIGTSLAWRPGCTPGAAPHAKNRREHGTAPGEFGYEASTAKASRQSPIIVRSGTDSVNLFRQQIYKAFVNVALKPQKRDGLFFDFQGAAGSGVVTGRYGDTPFIPFVRCAVDAHKTPHAPKYLILCCRGVPEFRVSQRTTAAESGGWANHWRGSNRRNLKHKCHVWRIISVMFRGQG